MSHHVDSYGNLPPEPDYRQSPVKRRLSFADLSRQDIKVRQAGQARRLISYPKPSEEAQTLRQSLADKGLVIGERFNEGGSQDRECFVIPSSVRPMSRDKSTYKNSPDGYDDLQIFFHLGRLLGQAAQEGPELPLVLEDPVSLNVAIDQRERPLGEPMVLFVPGFERQVTTAESDDAVLSFYSNSLYDELGSRFEANAERFEEGLQTTWY